MSEREKHDKSGNGHHSQGRDSHGPGNGHHSHGPDLSPEALAMVAQRFRVLGDPTRLSIIQGLFAGEQSVQDICGRVGTSQANISKHLTVLVDQGLLSRRKDGLFVYYSIADPSLFQLCELVCSSISSRFERALNSFNAPLSDS